MARSMKHCDSLQWWSPASAGWLSWIVDVDRPSVEDTHTARNVPAAWERYVHRAWHVAPKQLELESSRLHCLGCLYISQGSVATHLRCGGIFNDSTTTNFSWFWQSNNFENRLIFGKLKAYKNGANFWATLYIPQMKWTG